MYETIKVTEAWPSLMLTIHRPASRNSINQQFLAEIQHIFDHVEQNPDCRFVILQGENDVFCTGMDFKEVIENSMEHHSFSLAYMQLLKRLTTTSKVIISLLDGQVLAGGVGIVAASDLVLSTAKTQFGLSEALWGLLPACVLPFLIRRVGFQKAYYMTLTTQTMMAHEAQRIGLVDELTENLHDSLRRIIVRLTRIQEETIHDLKAYFRKLWMITDAVEATAVTEINRLVNKPNVQANIKNFVLHQQLPWEK